MRHALVGAKGFEPSTSCSQSKRATGLRYAQAVNYSPISGRPAESGAPVPCVRACRDRRLVLDWVTGRVGDEAFVAEVEIHAGLDRHRDTVAACSLECQYCSDCSAACTKAASLVCADTSPA